MIVRCRSCHRTERWTDGGPPIVELVGGSRRSNSPERDVFAILARSFRGEIGPVVGHCPACDGPMVADGSLPRIGWTIATPRGPIRFDADGTVTDPAGATTLDAAEQAMAEAYPEIRDPPMGWWNGSVFVLMLAPVALWIVAFAFVILFLTQISVGP